MSAASSEAMARQFVETTSAARPLAEISSAQPLAETSSAPRKVVCRVVCNSVELKVTLTQKLLVKPLVDALLAPFLQEYNKKAPPPTGTPLTAYMLKKVVVDGKRVSNIEAPAGSVLLGDAVRVVLTPERDKLVLDNAEWGSDEDEEDVMGHKLHRRNLSELTPYLHRAGLWRVRLNPTFEILEVVGSKNGGPPQPNEFSLKVTADGKEPTNGSLQRLSDKGAAYVKCLVNDLQKICRAKDLAHADAIATRDSTRGDAHVQELTKAVGTLPRSKVEVREEERQRLATEAEEKAAQRARDEREVQEHLGHLSLAQELCKAEKKAAKRARQKARKKQAAEGMPEEQGAAAEEGAADGTTLTPARLGRGFEDDDGGGEDMSFEELLALEKASVRASIAPRSSRIDQID